MINGECFAHPDYSLVLFSSFQRVPQPRSKVPRTGEFVPCLWRRDALENRSAAFRLCPDKRPRGEWGKAKETLRLPLHVPRRVSSGGRRKGKFKNRNMNHCPQSERVGSRLEQSGIIRISWFVSRHHTSPPAEGHHHLHAKCTTAVASDKARRRETADQIGAHCFADVTDL